MSIVLSTIPFLASDPTAVASGVALVGATATWLLLKGFEQLVRH